MVIFFIWLFSLIQWSCISRCQNIDHLSFFHVSVKGGAMVIELDVTKVNKRGEKLPPKHCYDNSLDYTICIFTEMGVYFSLFNSICSYENQSFLSIKPRARDSSTSIR